MLLKLLNMFLVERVIAQGINVLPNKPANVPGKFSNPGGVDFAGENLGVIISFVFDFIIAIAGGIFVIMLLVGGVIYLTGAGNEEQTGKGKKMMIDAVVGIFIVLAAWGIGTYILRSFGLTDANL